MGQPQADPALTTTPLSLAARPLQAEPPEHAAHARREGLLRVGGGPDARRRRPLAVQVLLGPLPECQVSQRYVSPGAHV